MSDKKKKSLNKFDFFLIILGVLLLLPLIFFLLTKTSGDCAVVYQNSQAVKTISLKKDATYTFESEDGGINIVSVENGEIYVKEADCPGQDCVIRGKISDNNESIVCLPHKLSITVHTGEKEYDAEVLR